jgi:hypothetical protein
MFRGNAIFIRVNSRLATLLEPNIRGIAELHPVEEPEIVIAKKVGQATNLSEFIDTFSCLRPSITHVAQKDEMVFCTIKTRSLQALAECAVCAVDITQNESPSHFDNLRA